MHPSEYAKPREFAKEIGRPVEPMGKTRWTKTSA